MLSKFHLPAIAGSGCTTPTSGWHYLHHAIPSHAQTLRCRRMELGVDVVQKYLNLLTKFCFLRISHFSMTWYVVALRDVMHQASLSII